MTIENYQMALLKAIDNYKIAKGIQLTKQRHKDIEELRTIIKTTNNNPETLQTAILKRVNAIKTGWWIFKTGNSQLKSGLLKVVQDSQFSLSNLLAEEIKKNQQRLNQLQSQSLSMVSAVQLQQKKLQENHLQLKVQQQLLGKANYYFTYEDYILNLLDKFMQQTVLSELEVKQILWLREDRQLLLIDKDRQEAVYKKLADACKYALNTLICGIDYLVIDGSLKQSQMSCLTRLADDYCELLTRENLGKGKEQATKAIDKLTLSYLKDGAGKTSISNLKTDDKNFIHTAKEHLILNYGNSKQCEYIKPLTKLRSENKWEEFKKACLLQGQYFSQWIKKSSSHPLYKIQITTTSTNTQPIAKTDLSHPLPMPIQTTNS